jgi:hypothetical protein
MNLVIDQLFRNPGDSSHHFRLSQQGPPVGFLPVGGKDRVWGHPRHYVNELAMPVTISFIVMRADVGVKLLQVQFQVGLSSIKDPETECRGSTSQPSMQFWSNKLMQHSPAASVDRLLYDSHSRRLANQAGKFRWQPRDRSKAA